MYSRTLYSFVHLFHRSSTGECAELASYPPVFHIIHSFIYTYPQVYHSHFLFWMFSSNCPQPASFLSSQDLFVRLFSSLFANDSTLFTVQSYPHFVGSSARFLEIIPLFIHILNYAIRPQKYQRGHLKYQLATSYQ